MVKRLLIFIVFTFLIACSSSSSDYTKEQLENRSIALDTFEKINNYRKSIGKSELIWNEEIYELSLEHSINMDKGIILFGHEGFNERSEKLFEWGYNSTGENVHYSTGYSNPASVAVSGWINSPGHKANIEGDFNESAIGVSSIDGKTYYFTQIFCYKGD